MNEPTMNVTSRRALLRVCGCAALGLGAYGMVRLLLGSETAESVYSDKDTTTPLLEDAGAWQYANGLLVLDLDRVPGLKKKGGAVRIEDDRVPEPLLLLHGQDGELHVYLNRCTHADRRVDPVGGRLQCVSMSAATFAYDGTVLSGPAKSPLTHYRVEVEGNLLRVSLS